MKTLLVLRHAKSRWSDPELDDHERPLNARGRRDGPRMGQLVREHGLIPDIVISSDAVRARLTDVINLAMAAQPNPARARVVPASVGRFTDAPRSLSR